MRCSFRWCLGTKFLFFVLIKSSRIPLYSPTGCELLWRWVYTNVWFTLRMPSFQAACAFVLLFTSIQGMHKHTDKQLIRPSAWVNTSIIYLVTLSVIIHDIESSCPTGYIFKYRPIARHFHNGKEPYIVHGMGGILLFEYIALSCFTCVHTILFEVQCLTIVDLKPIPGNWSG